MKWNVNLNSEGRIVLTPTLHLTDWQIAEAALYAARRDERRRSDRRHARPREVRRQPKFERKEK